MASQISDQSCLGPTVQGALELLRLCAPLGEIVHRAPGQGPVFALTMIDVLQSVSRHCRDERNTDPQSLPS